jgi:hypothetical protein
MTEPVRLPLAEAARLLGTTVDALRKKVKRGHLQAVRDNAGRLLVWVDAPPPGGQVSSLSSHVQAGRLDGLASQESTPVQPLRDYVETLKAQLARAEVLADAARQRADDLADRLAAAERERAVDQTARAVAEAEVSRLRAELERERRPWWHRLMGR